jgi:hypothetical protein
MNATSAGPNHRESPLNSQQFPSQKISNFFSRKNATFHHSIMLYEKNEEKLDNHVFMLTLCIKKYAKKGK